MLSSNFRSFSSSCSNLGCLQALFERAKLTSQGKLLGWAGGGGGGNGSAAVVQSLRGRVSNSSTGTPPAGAAAMQPPSAHTVGLVDSAALEADARRKWGQAEALTRAAAAKVLARAHVVCATCAGSGDPQLEPL